MELPGVPSIQVDFVQVSGSEEGGGGGAQPDNSSTFVNPIPAHKLSAKRASLSLKSRSFGGDINLPGTASIDPSVELEDEEGENENLGSPSANRVRTLTLMHRAIERKARVLRFLRDLAHHETRIFTLCMKSALFA